MIVLRSREMTDVLSAAASGVGLAVLPCVVGDEAAELKRVTPAVLTKHALWLVYSREARLAGPVRDVIRFLTETTRRNAGRLAGTRR